MKRFPLLLSFLFLFTACGTYTPSNSDYSNSPPFAHRQSSSYQRNSSSLPSNPDPNKCYVRCVTPDEFETYEEEYLTYSEEEAKDFPHKRVRLTITPEIKQWEATAYEGCESDDPNDCQVLCLRTYPAVEEIIYRPIDTTLGKPFYKLVAFSELIRQGGLTSYEEIDCGLTSYNVLSINFAGKSVTIPTENYESIDDRLLNLLRDRPNIRVQINAHTDSRGGSNMNQSVSEQRAKAVADYLVSRGISRFRLVIKGFGESQLKNRCADGVNCSDSEHSVNRRVEFKVLNMDS